MAQRRIEIEKKFLLTPNFKDTLLQEGAILVSEKEFSDFYYDLPDHKLSLQNFWLRRRNGFWELKYLGKGMSNSSLIDSFCETDNENDILSALADCVPAQDFKGCESLSEFVERFDLQVFVSFKTKRTKYQLGDVTVDLDIASFGYELGEIEIVVDDEEEVPNAKAKLETMAKKLGQ